MILKFRQHNAWRIIDNVSEVDILPKSELTTGDQTGVVFYTRGSETLKQYFDGAAFLLNDNGKTIERLDNPAVHMVPCV